MGTGGSGGTRRRNRGAIRPELLGGLDGEATGEAAVIALRRARGGPRLAPVVAFQQFIESRIAAQRTERTAKDYGVTLLALATFLDERRGIADIWDVAPDDLDAWVLSLRNEVSERTGRRRSAYTVQTYARQMGICWRWLEARGMVPPRVAATLSVPSIPPSEVKVPRTFNEEDVSALLAACAFDGQGPGEALALRYRNRALVTVLCDAGVREDELCSMCMEDLDLSSLSFAVRRSKTKKRTVGFGQESLTALRRYLQHGRLALITDTEGTYWDEGVTEETGPVWVGRDGRALQPIGVNKLFVRLRQRVDLSVHATPHTCRRYAITRALQAGLSVLEASRQFGVSPDVIYRHYYSATEEERLRAVRATSPMDRRRQEQLVRDRSRPGRLPRRGGFRDRDERE